MGVPGSGRKQTPTALKVIRGNPGKRALNRHEPQPARGDSFKCPTWLPRAGKAEWRRQVKALDPTKMLTDVDRMNLASYCEAVAILEEAARDIEAHGATVYVVETESKDGKTIFAKASVNPAVNTAMKAMNTIRSVGSEFGFTPASRARISVPQPKADDRKALLSG